jgi:hypothetical protein
MEENKNINEDGIDYYGAYDNDHRWLNYWEQIKFVRELSKINKDKTKLLEIGVGNKTVSEYLKRRGIEVTTADINNKLKPDIILDLTDIKLKDDLFDIVLCCEVLEHIPLKKVPLALKGLYRITKRFVIISIPYHAFGFGFSFLIPLIGKKDFIFRLPFPKKHRFDGQHYWEMGKRGVSRNMIRNMIKSSGFQILKEKNVPLQPYYYFFILEKRQKNER